MKISPDIIEFEVNPDYFECNGGEITFSYNWKALLHNIIDKVGLSKIVAEIGEDACLVEIKKLKEES